MRILAIHFQAFEDARVLDRFITNLQANDRVKRQHIRAAWAELSFHAILRVLSPLQGLVCLD